MRLQDRLQIAEDLLCLPACQGFYDLYHLNGVGQKLVTDRLLDELAWMYGTAKP
jgi:hypothetical protein